MNVLQLSTTDIEGGAARAAYRLHRGLRNIGVTSQMLVRGKFSNDRTVTAERSTLAKLGPAANNLPLRLYSNRERVMFSPQWFPDSLAAKVAQLKPNVINLHWICNGYLQIETLSRLKQPLIWTLHDMWAFTGGCHYTQLCERYKNSCGACPQLKSHKDWDLSRWIWQRKSKAWQALNLTVVSPSEWLAECARDSALFRNVRVEVIPHGLDLERYKPFNKQTAREFLNLPQDKKLVVFGAAGASTNDPRKGFHLLQPALQKLSQSGWQEQIELVVFGASRPEQPTPLGFKDHYLDRLHDDLSLAITYSAADVMIVPSVQEAFGQTASEAMACGTPVVAFDVTGLKDIVDHQQDGYLAQPFEIEDLAQGIAWVLADQERHQKLCINARKKAEQNFKLELQAERYHSLYTEILDKYCFHQH